VDAEELSIATENKVT